MTTWQSLDEAASALGKSRRTAFRMLSDGRIVRVTGDDGNAVYVLNDTSATGADTAKSPENESAMALNSVALTPKMAPNGEAADEPEPASQPPGRPSKTTPTVAPEGVRAVREARVRADLHKLAGSAYAALLDAAAAIEALDEGAKDRLTYAEAFGHLEPIAGQPGPAAWRALADALGTNLGEVREMLDARILDDATIAGITLALRRVERTWQAAREWEVHHFLDDPEPLLERIASETAAFGRAFAALRHALTE